MKKFSQFIEYSKAKLGCRWIYGNPGEDNDWHYCTNSLDSNAEQWCSEHKSLVYQSVKKHDNKNWAEHIIESAKFVNEQ